MLNRKGDVTTSVSRALVNAQDKIIAGQVAEEAAFLARALYSGDMQSAQKVMGRAGLAPQGPPAGFNEGIGRRAAAEVRYNISGTHISIRSEGQWGRFADYGTHSPDPYSFVENARKRRLTTSFLYVKNGRKIYSSKPVGGATLVRGPGEAYLIIPKTVKTTGPAQESLLASLPVEVAVQIAAAPVGPYRDGYVADSRSPSGAGNNLLNDRAVFAGGALAQAKAELKKALEDKVKVGEARAKVEKQQTAFDKRGDSFERFNILDSVLNPKKLLSAARLVENFDASNRNVGPTDAEKKQMATITREIDRLNGGPTDRATLNGRDVADLREIFSGQDMDDDDEKIVKLLDQYETITRRLMTASGPESKKIAEARKKIESSAAKQIIAAQRGLMGPSQSPVRRVAPGRALQFITLSPKSGPARMPQGSTAYPVMRQVETFIQARTAALNKAVSLGQVAP